MQEACEASSGGMAAIVGLDEEAVRGVCEQAGVSLANLNCPGQIVVSGDADKMDSACIAGTMVDQVTSSVLWEACIRAMIADGVTRFIELGPGTALTGFMRRIDRGLEVLNVADNDSLAKSAEALNA